MVNGKFFMLNGTDEKTLSPSVIPVETGIQSVGTGDQI